MPEGNSLVVIPVVVKIVISLYSVLDDSVFFRFIPKSTRIDALKIFDVVAAAVTD